MCRHEVTYPTLRVPLDAASNRPNAEKLIRSRSLDSEPRQYTPQISYPKSSARDLKTVAFGTSSQKYQ